MRSQLKLLYKTKHKNSKKVSCETLSVAVFYKCYTMRQKITLTGHEIKMNALNITRQLLCYTTVHTHACTHAHTHTFNGLFFRTTWVSWYQKGKTDLDFTGATDSE